MNEVDRCLVCSRITDLELHHVAGRANDDAFIVAVCIECHQILTRWQYAAGTNLASGDRDPVDIARAVIIGSVHLERVS